METNLEPSKLEGCQLALRRCVEARCQDRRMSQYSVSFVPSYCTF